MKKIIILILVMLPIVFVDKLYALDQNTPLENIDKQIDTVIKDMEKARKEKNIPRDWQDKYNSPVMWFIFNASRDHSDYSFFDLPNLGVGDKVMRYFFINPPHPSKKLSDIILWIRLDGKTGTVIKYIKISRIAMALS